MPDINRVNLSDILPREAMRPLTDAVNKAKQGQVQGSLKQFFVGVLTPHKEYMASKGADLDYIGYYLEFAVTAKLI
jgi:hypothetical protein